MITENDVHGELEAEIRSPEEHQEGGRRRKAEANGLQASEENSYGARRGGREGGEAKAPLTLPWRSGDVFLVLAGLE
jgi:hypothetical protein